MLFFLFRSDHALNESKLMMTMIIIIIMSLIFHDNVGYNNKHNAGNMHKKCKTDQSTRQPTLPFDWTRKL